VHGEPACLGHEILALLPLIIFIVVSDDDGLRGVLIINNVLFLEETVNNYLNVFNCSFRE
jgi:hypothetical protein